MSEETGYCTSCRGEGVIHTGIDESPVTECSRCDGTGELPVCHPPAVTAKPDLAAPVEQASAEPAPPNSLPSWSECEQRVENSDFIAKRIAEGGHGADGDSLLASELHRFIYEYDDADPYRSAWFLHRLEKLLAETAAASIPPQQAPDPIYLIRPKAGGQTWTECISKQSHDAAMRLGVYESRVVVEVGGQEKAS